MFYLSSYFKIQSHKKKCFCVLLLLFTGITKQLFPNSDDVSIRRMIGQKLNNCTKKPNLSKNMNSQDIK